MQCSVDAIDGALRRVFIYREEDEEIVRSPEFMLRDLGTMGYLEGDCDDIATLAAAAALVCGFRVRFVAVRYTATVAHFEHVFLEVLEYGSWRVLDLTVPIGTTIHALEVMEEEV